MTVATRDRVLSFARATRSPTRAAVQRQRLWLGAAAFATSTTTLALFHGVRIAPRPEWLAAVTSLGAAALAAVALWMAAGRGASMLGRSQRALAATVVAVPLALIVWKVAFTACVDGMGDRWEGRPGLRCMLVGLLAGLGPFAALVIARRRSAVGGEAWLGATVGVAAGAVAWMVNDLRCQVGYLPHLMLGHVLPLLFFVVLGVTVAGWLVPRAPLPT